MRLKKRKKKQPVQSRKRKDDLDSSTSSIRSLATGRGKKKGKRDEASNQLVNSPEDAPIKVTSETQGKKDHIIPQEEVFSPENQDTEVDTTNKQPIQIEGDSSEREGKYYQIHIDHFNLLSPLIGI